MHRCLAFAPFGTTAQSPPCIMLYLAIANLSWAIVWVTIFFFTPEGGIHRAPASDLAVLLYEAYHWASAAILLCFYFGTVRRYLPTVRLTTYEAKKFLSVGMIASVANVLINILSSTFGPSRSVRLFIACAIQNTLMYNGLVLAVLIYDRWNMNAEVRPTASFDRACLSALVVSKAITITTLFAIGVTYTLSEDHPMIVGGSSTPLTITLVNFNRAFLIYFGLLKMIYLARKLKLPPRDAARLAAQCARDAQLLRALNIMDYSLLLGVRLVAPSERAGPAAAARHDGPCVWTSEDGHAIYYVTIIDLLQSWDLGKQLERLLKLGFYCRCGSAEGLSVVEPAQYAHRFIQMVERILDQPTSDDP